MHAPRDRLVEVDSRADGDVVEQPLDVLVAQADASVSDPGADGVRVRRAVQLIAVTEREPEVTELTLDAPVLRASGRDEDRVVEHDVLVEHQRNELLLARRDDAYLVAARRQARSSAQPHS